jgi:hypothetical protein
MTSSEGLKRLVEQARSDPSFFHELVFNPKKAIERAKYLDEKTKLTLRRLNADFLLRNLLPDKIAECGGTCGDGSCTSTCGAGSCLDTCKSSCGSTCGAKSCDHTSGFGEIIEEDPLMPGGIAAGGVVKAKAIKGRAGAKSQQ